MTLPLSVGLHTEPQCPPSFIPLRPMYKHCSKDRAWTEAAQGVSCGMCVRRVGESRFESRWAHMFFIGAVRRPDFAQNIGRGGG